MRSVIILLLLISICVAQTSTGTTALETKIVNGYDPDCSMTDLAVELINDRSSTCAQGQTGFFNGERRSVNFGSGVYLLDADHIQNGYELTSCACSQNGTWTRVMEKVTTTHSSLIRWNWKFYARRADCSLELKRDLTVLGCSVTLDADECGCLEGTFPAESVCDCVPGTPIAIDLDGDGLKLTSRTNGVRFDFDGNGETGQIPWLTLDDGWLVLNDREDRIIHDGRQFFGDRSPQPQSSEPNGYRALAIFDDDRDNAITSADGIWDLLAIWRDLNHNGISEAGEVAKLDSLGIRAISLNYRESRRRDRYGNQLRYRARVIWTGNRKSWSYDVVFSNN
jgi:hypothetical protein